jgi:multiple antibiotic resistance protein
MKEFLSAFLPLFFAIGAIDFVPLVIGLTKGMEERERARVLREAALAAALILAVFMAVGRALFVLLGVAVGDFMVAGGILLLVFAVRALIVDDSGPDLKPGAHVGIVPLATPLIAGPAALASTLILLDTYGPRTTLLSIASNCFVAWLILAGAPTLRRILGERVIQGIAKVSYILLASIAVMMIRRGLMQILGH